MTIWPMLTVQSTVAVQNKKDRLPTQAQHAFAKGTKGNLDQSQNETLACCKSLYQCPALKRGTPHFSPIKSN